MSITTNWKVSGKTEYCRFVSVFWHLDNNQFIWYLLVLPLNSSHCQWKKKKRKQKLEPTKTAGHSMQFYAIAIPANLLGFSHVIKMDQNIDWHLKRWNAEHGIGIMSWSRLHVNSFHPKNPPQNTSSNYIIIFMGFFIKSSTSTNFNMISTESTT